jgi:hypothetical protein
MRGLDDRRKKRDNRGVPYRRPMRVRNQKILSARRRYVVMWGLLPMARGRGRSAALGRTGCQALRSAHDQRHNEPSHELNARYPH